MLLSSEHNSWDVCKDPPRSLKQAASVAPGGKRTGQGRARPAGANGGVDTEDIMVSTATVGGETVKTYKIKIGIDYLTPKVIGEYLFLTTVKATPQVEAASEAMTGATVAEADEAYDGDE
jgi:hypothetical protein